jgi:hypothetical protein
MWNTAILEMESTPQDGALVFLIDATALHARATNEQAQSHARQHGDAVNAAFHAFSLLC